jgi:hypothetical protein
LGALQRASSYSITGVDLTLPADLARNSAFILLAAGKLLKKFPIDFIRFSPAMQIMLLIT